MKNEDKVKWDKLIRRYFDGLTTIQEEKQLREFLNTSEGMDSRYDDLRAVMSFLSVGKRMHNRNNRKRREPKTFLVFPVERLPNGSGLFQGRRRYWSAVAAIVVIFGVFTIQSLIGRNENVCYAYINGEKTSDVEIVRKQMLQSVNDIEETADSSLIQTQLNDMFAPL